MPPEDTGIYDVISIFRYMYHFDSTEILICYEIDLNKLKNKIEKY